MGFFEGALLTPGSANTHGWPQVEINQVIPIKNFDTHTVREDQHTGWVVLMQKHEKTLKIVQAFIMWTPLLRPFSDL